MMWLVALVMVSPVETARRAVDDLLSTLQATLKAELQTHGPVGALAVCRDTAQVLLQRVSRTHGQIYLRRVSRKWRNPADIPTPDEDSLLRVLEERAASGELPSEWVDTLVLYGQKVLRYARPLTVQGVCLVCHGENLPPKVDRALRKLYPHDRARGYRVGDFRGMVVVKLPLEGAEPGGSP